MKQHSEIWPTEHAGKDKSGITAHERLLLFYEENNGIDEELHECGELKLNAPAVKFSRKNLLKKTTADITHSQFEYLCAGYIENDLSDEQIAELEQVVASDAGKRNELELFRHTKLSPPDITFRGKRKLLRATSFRKTLRISVAALTAAASVAILVIMPHFAPKNNLPYNPAPHLSAGNDKTESITAPQTSADETGILPVGQSVAAHVSEEIITAQQDEPAVTDYGLTPMHGIPEPAEIPLLSSINIALETPSRANALLPLNNVYNSSIEKPHLPAINLALIFRKNILKEAKPDDSPIKTYELAKAGINGLNKLLGWEMDLEEAGDEHGNVKAVKFSSRLLTVKLPVADS